MLSGVLRSKSAIAVNIEIMRAFARLRRLYGEHAELTQRLDELEARFDESFSCCVRRDSFPAEPGEHDPPTNRLSPAPSLRFVLCAKDARLMAAKTEACGRS